MAHSTSCHSSSRYIQIYKKKDTRLDLYYFFKIIIIMITFIIIIVLIIIIFNHNKTYHHSHFVSYLF